MKKILALGLLVLSTTAFAQKEGSHLSYSMPALEFGFKWNTADLTGATSNVQVVGYQLGGSIVMNINSDFGIKTGLFYSERPFKSDFSGAEVKGKINYFDIPVFLMFKIEDYAGIYAGPSLAVKLGDESTPSGSLTDIKGTVMPLTLGAQFKFESNMGINIFFETISGSIAKDVQNTRAVGANFLLTFD